MQEAPSSIQFRLLIEITIWKKGVGKTFYFEPFESIYKRFWMEVITRLDTFY